MAPSAYPSIPITPRYLTGDGPALNEFVEKYDVCFSMFCWELRLTNLCVGVPIRLRWSVIRYPAPSALPSLLQRGLSDISCETGVLWSGDHLFPGTVETLDMLKSRGMHGSTESI